MLPLRLNNYDLRMTLAPVRMMSTTDGVEYEVQKKADTDLVLHCEYLTAPEDTLERLSMYCPLFVKKDISNPVLGVKYDITFINGPPAWLYIRHDPVALERFRLLYRERPAVVLEKATAFDHFKMVHRASNEQSAIQFEQWDQGTRGFLVRLEELGLAWAPGATEWTDRYTLRFEVLEASAALNSVTVYGVYEHFVCDDEHHKSDFRYV